MMKELYLDWKKPRRLFEIFLLIKRGEVCTKKELAEKFNISIDTVENYIQELNLDFKTDINNQG